MVFEDARAVPNGTLIETDLCIIGGGPAGITVALQLLNSSTSVTLVEGGGEFAEEANQELNQGEVVSNVLPGAEYLVSSRLRQFGGASNHWAGICGALSAIDFQPRAGVPNSGWPFDLRHLQPFYDRACPLVEVCPFINDRRRFRRRPLCFAEHVGIETIVKVFGPPTKFRLRHGPALGAARNVKVLLQGNVTELRTDAHGRSVTSARVATLAGNVFSIRARRFVLAVGGVENARLLLASRNLGNGHDLVGRHFMEHVYQIGDPGRVILATGARSVSLYQDPGLDDLLNLPTLGRFVLAERLQREYALPNHGVGLRRLRLRPSPIGAAATVQDDGAAPGAPDTFIGALGIDLELVPDPTNRVMLSRETDALGMPRPVLEWKLTPLDKENAVRYLTVFAQRLRVSELGRAQVSLTTDYDWSRFITSDHHMGTTRMHEDPRRGVVDPDCKVHGVSNLYIAGSSVFPTSGQMNPTLTIVALAIRLADHLKAVAPEVAADEYIGARVAG